MPAGNDTSNRYPRTRDESRPPVLPRTIPSGYRLAPANKPGAVARPRCRGTPRCPNPLVSVGWQKGV